MFLIVFIELLIALIDFAKPTVFARDKGEAGVGFEPSGYTWGVFNIHRETG
jgi:hypothetical protein